MGDTTATKERGSSFSAPVSRRPAQGRKKPKDLQALHHNPAGLSEVSAELCHEPELKLSVARDLSQRPQEREVHLAIHGEGRGYHNAKQDHRQSGAELLQAGQEGQQEDDNHIALFHHLEEWHAGLNF